MVKRLGRPSPFDLTNLSGMISDVLSGCQVVLGCKDVGSRGIDHSPIVSGAVWREYRWQRHRTTLPPEEDPPVVSRADTLDPQ